MNLYNKQVFVGINQYPYRFGAVVKVKIVTPGPQKMDDLVVQTNNLADPLIL